jgi:hypothetical protein
MGSCDINWILAKIFCKLFHKHLIVFGKVEKMFKIPLEVEMNHCDGWPSKEAH